MNLYGIRVRFLHLLIFGFLFSSCDVFTGEEDEDSQQLYLRILNNTSADDSDDNLIYGPITVVVYPDTDNADFNGNETVVDFGTIAIGETTEYKAVPNMFLIEVNGEPFGDSGFGISSPPSDEWILEISLKYDNGGGDFGYGWSQSIE